MGCLASKEVVNIKPALQLSEPTFASWEQSFSTQGMKFPFGQDADDKIGYIITHMCRKNGMLSLLPKELCPIIAKMIPRDAVFYEPPGISKKLADITNNGLAAKQVNPKCVIPFGNIFDLYNKDFKNHTYTIQVTFKRGTAGFGLVSKNFDLWERSEYGIEDEHKQKYNDLYNLHLNGDLYGDDPILAYDECKEKVDIKTESNAEYINKVVEKMDTTRFYQWQAKRIAKPNSYMSYSGIVTNVDLCVDDDDGDGDNDDNNDNDNDNKYDDYDDEEQGRFTRKVVKLMSENIGDGHMFYMRNGFTVNTFSGIARNVVGDLYSMYSDNIVTIEFDFNKYLCIITNSDYVYYPVVDDVDDRGRRPRTQSTPMIFDLTCFRDAFRIVFFFDKGRYGDVELNIVDQFWKKSSSF